MCNLYTERKSAAEVAAHFGVDLPVQQFNSAEDVYPGYPGMVVREAEGKRVLQSMTWGFPKRLANMKPTSKPKAVNNARDDNLLSPFGMWREWFTNPAQRCLIPFTAFAEAVGEKGRMTRTWISVADQPLAAWAGLWRPTDEWGNAYSGVMVDATEELLDIHDRMPVILHPQDYDAWLRAPAEEAFKLVRQYPGDRLVAEHTSDPWFARAKKSEPPSDVPTLL